MNYNLLYTIIFVENKNKRHKCRSGAGEETGKPSFDYYQVILQHQIGKIGHQFQTCDIKSAFCQSCFPPHLILSKAPKQFVIHFQGQWEKMFFLTEEQFSAGFTLLFRVL